MHIPSAGSLALSRDHPSIVRRATSFRTELRRSVDSQYSGLFSWITLSQMTFSFGTLSPSQSSIITSDGNYPPFNLLRSAQVHLATWVSIKVVKSRHRFRQEAQAVQSLVLDAHSRLPTPLSACRTPIGHRRFARQLYSATASIQGILSCLKCYISERDCQRLDLVSGTLSNQRHWEYRGVTSAPCSPKTMDTIYEYLLNGHVWFR